ncbi:MAG: hypothetical protein ABGY10_00535, partial [bacterium]
MTQLVYEKRISLRLGPATQPGETHTQIRTDLSDHAPPVFQQGTVLHEGTGIAPGIVFGLQHIGKPNQQTFLLIN